MRSYASVGTLNLFGGGGGRGIWEIKTINKTKEEKVVPLECLPHHAHESQSQKWKQMWQVKEHNQDQSVTPGW